MMSRKWKPLCVLLTTICLAVLTDCGNLMKKKKNDASTDNVTLTGQLLISDSSDNSLSLADTTDYSKFKVVCNTLGANGQSCVIAVNQNGTFSGGCPNFKDQSSGCVLEDDGKVVGNVVFDQNPLVTPTSGNIQTSITITKSTGEIITKVDQGGSSALTGSGSATATPTSWATPISGSWTASCSTDPNDISRFNRHESCPDGQKIFIDTYDASKSLYALWENKARYDACLPAAQKTASESKPYFHVTIANGTTTTDIPLQFGKVAQLETTLDTIYNALPAVIKTSIDNAADDISVRAGQLAQTVDAIRAATTIDFGGVLRYRVPEVTELKRRLTLKLLQISPLTLADTDFCGPLIVDETLPSMYRRTHSLEPELICTFKSDGQLAALKSFVAAQGPLQCLPDLFYDVAYNATSKAEEVVMKCVGSSAADLSCYDKTPTFIGQIVGRVNVLQLNNRTEGAFDLYQKRSSQLIVVHPTHGLLPCAIQYESVIEGYKESDNHFKATVGNRVVNRCEGAGASQELSDWYGSRVSALVKRLTNMYKADFTRG